MSPVWQHHFDNISAKNCQDPSNTSTKTQLKFSKLLKVRQIKLKLRMEMWTVSKRQQTALKAENSPRQPISLQHSQKISHPEARFSTNQQCVYPFQQFCYDYNQQFTWFLFSKQLTRFTSYNYCCQLSYLTSMTWYLLMVHLDPFHYLGRYLRGIPTYIIMRYIRYTPATKRLR